MEQNMEREEEGTRSLDLLQDIDVQKVKDFVCRLVSEDNVNDLREGGEYILKAKEKVFEVLCRVFQWDDLQDNDARSIPDPIVDRAVETIQKSPEYFERT